MVRVKGICGGIARGTASFKAKAMMMAAEFVVAIQVS
jgi:hypothetical protein